MINFSWMRVFSIIAKEWGKIRRDPSVIAMLIAIPIIQIVLFGYAINVFPKHLPTALVDNEQSPYTRHYVKSINTSGYMDINFLPQTQKEAKELMQNGKANFIIEIPTNFTKDLIRGTQPHLLLITDTTVPGALGYALKAIGDLSEHVFDRQFSGSLNYLTQSQKPFVIDFHSKYNPDLVSANAVAPGLVGVIVTFSLLLVTSMIIVEEKESGTMEMLLNSPIQILEILIGKFICYLVIGYIQLMTVLFLSTHVLFDVPMFGSYFVLLTASLPFLMTNLMIGLAASSIAQNQLQSLQIVTVFLLPSILLSGFVFPFYGMPVWAQWIGNILPLTHYIRITSGIMLKGYSWLEVFANLWPIVLFLIFITTIASFSFKKTLD